MTDACSDIASKCYNVKDFSQNVINSMERLGKKGPKPGYPTSSIEGVCCADSFNANVVAPNGDLYKCWTEISQDSSKSVGSVLKKSYEPHQLNNLSHYLNWDPFSIEECKVCRYLPICAGGCPYQSLANQENCASWRYYLPEMLSKVHDEILLNELSPVQQQSKNNKISIA